MIVLAISHSACAPTWNTSEVASSGLECSTVAPAETLAAPADVIHEAAHRRGRTKD